MYKTKIIIDPKSKEDKAEVVFTMEFEVEQ